MLPPLCRACLFAFAMFMVPALHAQREKLPPEDLEFVEKTWPNARKTNTGIRYIIQVEGKGDTPQPGDLVSLLYAGRLLNNVVFEEGRDRKRPIKFRIGRDEVIAGWDEIVQLMKRGEKRLVIIPSELGYGTRGSGPRIPRNATLVFEMELVDFKRE